MCSRLSGIAIGMVALMAVGCSERNQPLLPTSSMQAAAPLSGITCDFKSLNQFATHYFSAQEAKAARGLISAMQTAGAFTATAQDRGFDVMTHVALAQTYDWKVAPNNTSFAPPVMVGVCIDPFTATTSLLREEHTGLLPFEDFAELVPGVCSPVAARTGSAPAQLAARLLDLGKGLFLPSPLGANPGGLAGATGGIHSLFGQQVVDTITLTFATQPSDVNANLIITPPVQVLATAKTTGDAVPNVSVTLGSVD